MDNIRSSEKQYVCEIQAPSCNRAIYVPKDWGFIEHFSIETTIWRPNWNTTNHHMQIQPTELRQRTRNCL